MESRDRLIKLAKDRGIWLPRSNPSFYDPARDGVTFSVLSQFTQCKELVRLGLNGITSRGSSFALVFGTLTHAMLQFVYEAARRDHLTDYPDKAFVQKALAHIDAIWRKENPKASAETTQHAEFSLLMADAVLPRYFRYWRDDFTKVKWEAIEHEFRVPITVRLHNGQDIQTFVRGKMDGNFRHPDKRLFLFETKTKSHVDEETTSMILPHELQVNIYLWAMMRIHKERPAGVRYNIIRRPGLRQRKQEGIKEFASRCAQDVMERPDFYFLRMDMDVTRQDMDRFEGEFMDLLADFFSWWYGVTGHYKESSNCENRYGKCWMLPLCGRRDMSTFFVRDTVFRELEEV